MIVDFCEDVTGDLDDAFDKYEGCIAETGVAFLVITGVVLANFEHTDFKWKWMGNWTEPIVHPLREGMDINEFQEEFFGAIGGKFNLVSVTNVKMVPTEMSISSTPYT